MLLPINDTQVERNLGLARLWQLDYEFSGANVRWTFLCRRNVEWGPPNGALLGFLTRFLVAVPSCWLRPSGSSLFLLQRFSNRAHPVTPDRDVFTLRARRFRFII